MLPVVALRPLRPRLLSSFWGLSKCPEQATPAISLTPGTACVQWVWADSSTSSPYTLGMETDYGNCEVGLFPERVAFILLGPAPPSSADEDPQKEPLKVGDGSGPSMTMSRVLASEADYLRRCASQLKVCTHDLL